MGCRCLRGSYGRGKEVGGKSRVRKCRVDMVEKVELENVELTWGVGALGGVRLWERGGWKKSS